jgi:hypothetical protein
MCSIQLIQLGLSDHVSRLDRGLTIRTIYSKALLEWSRQVAGNRRIIDGSQCASRKDGQCRDHRSISHHVAQCSRSLLLHSARYSGLPFCLNISIVKSTSIKHVKRQKPSINHSDRHDHALGPHNLHCHGALSGGRVGLRRRKSRLLRSLRDVAEATMIRITVQNPH